MLKPKKKTTFFSRQHVISGKCKNIVSCKYKTKKQ